MRYRVIAATLVAVSTMAQARFAQASDPAAETLFQSGKTALDAGKLDEACASFAESQKLEPLPGTAFYLGECEEKRGRLASAWAAFEEARQRLPASDERLPHVVARVNALAPRLPMLVIRLSVEVPEGAVIRRDAVPVGRGSMEQAIAVDPGPHEITVEAKGYETATITVRAVESQTVEALLRLGDPLPASGPVVNTPADDTTKSNLLIAGGVIGGAGLLGIAAGVTTGFIAKGKYDGVQCNGNICNQDAFNERTDARSLGDVGTVVFALGIAGLAMPDANIEVQASPEQATIQWRMTW
jgi:hypothetical protein